jgi:TatA/E family protein of Tat protein translocase
MMFGSVGLGEILFILLVALLLFGSKELPQVARKVGKGYRDIQRLTQNTRDEIKKLVEEGDTDEKKKFRG